MALDYFNSKELFGYQDSNTNELIELAIKDFLDDEPTVFFYKSGDVCVIKNTEGFDAEYAYVPEITAAFTENDVMDYGYALPRDYVIIQAASELLSDLRNDGTLSEEQYEEIADDCAEYEWCEEHYASRLNEMEQELSQEYINEVSAALEREIVQKKTSVFYTFSPDMFYPPLEFDTDNVYLSRAMSDTLPEEFAGVAPDVLEYWSAADTGEIYVRADAGEKTQYACALLAIAEEGGVLSSFDDAFRRELAENIEFVGDALSSGATFEQLENEGSLASAAAAWKNGVPAQDIFA